MSPWSSQFLTLQFSARWEIWSTNSAWFDILQTTYQVAHMSHYEIVAPLFTHNISMMPRCWRCQNPCHVPVRIGYVWPWYTNSILHIPRTSIAADTTSYQHLHCRQKFCNIQAVSPASNSHAERIINQACFRATGLSWGYPLIAGCFISWKIPKGW